MSTTSDDMVSQSSLMATDRYYLVADSLFMGVEKQRQTISVIFFGLIFFYNFYLLIFVKCLAFSLFV